VIGPIIRPDQWRGMQWRNGRGFTHEVLVVGRGQSPDPEFLWRVSVATISADGPFSTYPGYDRTITLLDGAGMTLDISERGRVVIDEQHHPFSFSGDWHVQAALLAGPTRDLNIISDRSKVSQETTLLELGRDPAELGRAGREVFVFVIAGSVKVRAGDGAGVGLDVHDSVRLSADEGTVSIVGRVGGSARCIVAEFRRLLPTHTP
jgi:environmental stress-induced protein Ves